eukprot:GHVP01029569.1.p1 GENE.GHVP01029569.1~~GHVP01029569.1.p1  ORF type:complete len:217 (+),score=39.87 GHVP01029569.1:842-1492(+)
MYAELDSQISETQTLLDELGSRLKKLHNYTGRERNEKQQECVAIISQLKTIKESFSLELRSVDQEYKHSYEEAMRDHIRTFKHLLREFESKKHELDRSAIVAEAQQEDSNPYFMNSQQLAQEGDNIQDKTQESIDRMKAMVHEAEDIGVATTQKMDQQIEQMQRVQGNLDDVDYNLQRARGTVGKIAKDAASDRCIQILCVAIWICLIIVLVLLFV